MNEHIGTITMAVTCVIMSVVGLCLGLYLRKLQAELRREHDKDAKA